MKSDIFDQPGEFIDLHEYGLGEDGEFQWLPGRELQVFLALPKSAQAGYLLAYRHDCGPKCWINKEIPNAVFQKE